MSSPEPTTTLTGDAALVQEVARRRTFAIISHPDAGKTTLTEKLLLYGGAIHLAGTVKARRESRHVTSDWMEMERERGISVTSSVMQFDYGPHRVNLLDTPGHQDFSEDTFRTLVAADSAVMLLDNRKGVEARTRQLFDVCRRRRIPIVTFVNKCDRAGEDPLQLIQDVEADLGVSCYPITWPIYHDGTFAGVFHRQLDEVILFARGIDHGATRSESRRFPLRSPELRTILGAATHDQVVEEIDLLQAAGHPFDAESVTAGSLSPVYFGSALTNFGVEPFLADFLDFAPSPTARESAIGPINPTDPRFSGFVFKIQANMDPRHRDRIAFVRICSGRYEPGREVTLMRTGKTLRLASPQQFLARERSLAEEAWPGDVVGILDRGSLRIGDTLSEIPGAVFQDIPRFPPEHFARVHPSDPLRRKHLDTGLRELSEEGAAQVFYAESDAGPTPIVGAVGRLQFDVMISRLEHEYGATCRLEPLGYSHPRRVTGPQAAIDRAASHRGRLRLYDTTGAQLFIFDDAWAVRWAEENEKEVTFEV